MRSRIALMCVVIMVAAGEVVGVGGVADACGPYFDDAYLVRGSEREFLSMPEGDFKYELERIAGKKGEPLVHEQEVDWDMPEIGYDRLRAKTADADMAGLKEAMKAFRAPEWQKDQAIAWYAERRSRITEYLKKCLPANRWAWYGDQFRSSEKDATTLKILPGPTSPFMRLVPREFVLYSDGAVYYHDNCLEAAIGEWKSLLDLPAGERKWKSVWASFMIGKAYLALRGHEEAVRYFTMTREFAAQGYKDPLDLAQESYGWQALAEYETGRYAASLNHYLKTMDAVSMYRVCVTIADLNDADFEKVVGDETALRILIGWTVSHASYYFYSNDENTDYIRIATRLTEVISKNKLNVPADNADRIALMLYNLGKFREADHWLTASRERSALAQWIRAKLLIREGRAEEAIEIMRGLKHSFALDEEFSRFYGKISIGVERKINAEHGILLLHRNEYLMAFEVLLQGAYWEDIAYVAEKVLTISELERYIKNHKIPGDEKALGFCYAANAESPTVKKALEYLLARRLVRNGDLQKALAYMPEWFIRPDYTGLLDEPGGERFKPGEKLRNYIVLLKTAENAGLPKQVRAMSYFNAACLIRDYGMEIMGTELDPDWFVFDGGYDCDRTIENRFAILTDERKNYYKGWYDEKIEEIGKDRQKVLRERTVFNGSADEERRVLESLPDPNKRYHYRHKAADLMWRCAGLLPDNDELKAEALCLGGTYIKYRDNREADKFYKALVRTCGKTELGRMADKIRWFPDMKPETVRAAN